MKQQKTMGRPFKKDRAQSNFTISNFTQQNQNETQINLISLNSSEQQSQTKQNDQNFNLKKDTFKDQDFKFDFQQNIIDPSEFQLEEATNKYSLSKTDQRYLNITECNFDNIDLQIKKYGSNLNYDDLSQSIMTPSISSQQFDSQKQFFLRNPPQIIEVLQQSQEQMYYVNKIKRKQHVIDLDAPIEHNTAFQSMFVQELNRKTKLQKGNLPKQQKIEWTEKVPEYQCINLD